MADVGQDIQAKLRRLVEARVLRDETEAASKAAEKEYRQTEAEVWEDLEDSPLAGLNFPINLGEPFGVVRFQPRETWYGQVIDKEEALDYFEQRAMLDDVTDVQISKARINEIVRDCRERGVPLPQGLSFHARRYITITRQKS